MKLLLKYRIVLEDISFSKKSANSLIKLNYTIKKYLGKEYVGNGKNKLNLENSKFKVINFYNNKVHILIGTTPSLVYKITDNNKIN